MDQAIGKPMLGTPIPAIYKTDDYKRQILDLQRRLTAIEKIARVVPSYESPDKTIDEYNGFVIKRDLSSGMYEIVDEYGQNVPDLSHGKFNNLTRAQAHIDLYIKRTTNESDMSQNANA